MEFLDNSGNRCNSIVIGSQLWVACNLASGHFRNGDSIPLVESDEEWEALGEAHKPASCFYRNDPSMASTYGRLYNWYAVCDPRGLAPQDWRIPSVEDWKTLLSAIGGGHTAGRRLKDRLGWNNNGNGNNESGFNARPGGGRGAFGSFLDLGDYGNWWTSAASGSEEAAFLYLTFIDSSALIRSDGFKSSGLSVRCVTTAA
ncbi:MAG: fibrobacter succinogenes major paralogous domain-containing protein [Bacteroidota bacterium]